MHSILLLFTFSISENVTAGIDNNESSIIQYSNVTNIVNENNDGVTISSQSESIYDRSVLNEAPIDSISSASENLTIFEAENFNDKSNISINESTLLEIESSSDNTVEISEINNLDLQNNLTSEIFNNTDIGENASSLVSQESEIQDQNSTITDSPNLTLKSNESEDATATESSDAFSNIENSETQLNSTVIEDVSRELSFSSISSLIEESFFENISSTTIENTINDTNKEGFIDNILSPSIENATNETTEEVISSSSSSFEDVSLLENTTQQVLNETDKSHEEKSSDSLSIEEDLPDIKGESISIQVSDSNLEIINNQNDSSSPSEENISNSSESAGNPAPNEDGKMQDDNLNTNDQNENKIESNIQASEETEGSSNEEPLPDPPAVASISPSSCSAEGGAEVTLTLVSQVPEGRTVFVRFGSSEVRARSVAGKTVTAVAPPHSVGRVRVSISLDGQKFSRGDVFFVYGEQSKSLAKIVIAAAALVLIVAAIILIFKRKKAQERSDDLMISPLSAPYDRHARGDPETIPLKPKKRIHAD